MPSVAIKPSMLSVVMPSVVAPSILLERPKFGTTFDRFILIFDSKSKRSISDGPFGRGARDN
jgi:hypothetical protein